VAAGAGDGPLANLGIGAVGPGVAACSIGTSGALRTTVARPTNDADRRLFAYALDAERWVTGGAVNNGGSVLRWAGTALAPDLGDDPEDQLLAAAAAVPAGSEGLVMLPALNAERAPRWDATAQGAYVGLTARHGRGHLVRAAIEGATMQLALVLSSLRAAGHDVREVRATGGFARSPLWRQLLADVLDLPVAYPESTEGSGLGAAMVGFAALGLGSEPPAPPGRSAADGRGDPHPVSAPAASPDDRAETVQPDAAAAAVYAALLPVFARLQDDLAPGLRALRSASGAD
jgi:gluconokinase